MGVGIVRQSSVMVVLDDEQARYLGRIATRFCMTHGSDDIAYQTAFDVLTALGGRLPPGVPVPTTSANES